MDYRPILDALLLPERCLLCRRRASVEVWCAFCAVMMVPAHSRCYRCAGPRQLGHACWPDGASVTSTTTVFIDSQPLRRSLATATRNAAVRSWQALGATLARQYVTRDDAQTLVCAVPLTPRQQRSQPLDQRQLLAATFAQIHSFALGPSLTLQVKRRQQRAAKNSARLIGCHVVLVTDVLHTGESVWQAAQALSAAGSKSIDVVAVTRRGDEPLG